MAFHSTLKLQQSTIGAAVPDCWKLVPRQALTLHPDVPGVLRVARGRVWATLDGPHQGPANDWGDVVLRSGEKMRLLPGQQVVLEVYGDAVNEPAFFDWLPAQRVEGAPDAAPSPWNDALARPVLRVNLAVWRWPRAVERALMRLGALLSWLVQGRGRMLSPMEFNQP